MKRIGSLQLKTKISIAIGIVLLLWFVFALPERLFIKPTSFVIESESGTLLSAGIAGDGQWRFPYNDIVPIKFAQCITTLEDKRFYYHPGVDLLAMTRAVKQNFGGKKVISGGSSNLARFPVVVSMIFSATNLSMSRLRLRNRIPLFLPG